MRQATGVAKAAGVAQYAKQLLEAGTPCFLLDGIAMFMRYGLRNWQIIAQLCIRAVSQIFRRSNPLGGLFKGRQMYSYYRCVAVQGWTVCSIAARLYCSESWIGRLRYMNKSLVV
ncbi:hypothetical protein [Paenibacillus sp. QZ-Y1]|uniref:hypothetical protein n=1 Tax=Paenibacillus sp. QZ-Y1 TaxID=3414511 RepID=UPI003F7B0E5D